VRDLPAAGEVPGVRQSGVGWEVRNLEPQESELEACSAEEFARRLGVTLASDAGGSVTVAEEQKENEGKELRSGELWQWLWLALVVCLLGEGVLANRTVA
jgi:hypothetical protein